jgi:hypothetical protein
VKVVDAGAGLRKSRRDVAPQAERALG